MFLLTKRPDKTIHLVRLFYNNKLLSEGNQCKEDYRGCFLSQYVSGNVFENVYLIMYFAYIYLPCALENLTFFIEEQIEVKCIAHSVADVHVT